MTTPLKRLLGASAVLNLLAMALSITVASAAPPTPEQVSRWLAAGELGKVTEGADTFLQVTDAHVGPGRPDTAPRVLAETLNEMAELYPQAMFVVSTGDGGHETQFTETMKKSVLKPFFVPGNAGGGVQFRERFAEYFPWSHRHGKIAFYFLDTRLPFNHEGWISRDQLTDLHQELSEDAGKLVFIFGHHNVRKLGIINFDDLRDLLSFHRGRYRGIFSIAGHLHVDYLLESGGVHYQATTSLRDTGTYRVFHVREDCVISYDRRVKIWIDAKKEMGIQAPAATFVGTPRVIPLTDASEAGALPATDVGYRKLAERFAWRANEEGAEGTVLDVRFDEGDGIRARDRSSWQNGFCLESLSDESCHSATFKKVEMPSPWVPHGDGFAMTFGPRGAWHALGFNTKTLCSPARTNQLTLEADVRLPAEGPGFPYGIISLHYSYALLMKEDGTLNFGLTLEDGPSVWAVAPQPLKYDEWQRVTAVYDGREATLYVDGKHVVSTACPEGARLRLSPHGLRVGYYATRNWVDGKNTAPPVKFLLDNLRVSNHAEPPPER